MKEQGITTQEPTRARTRSGTEGTGETAWTPLHKTAVVVEDRKSFTRTDLLYLCLIVGFGAIMGDRRFVSKLSNHIAPQNWDIHIFSPL